jgi:hypothetical protein
MGRAGSMTRGRGEGSLPPSGQLETRRDSRGRLDYECKGEVMPSQSKAVFPNCVADANATRAIFSSDAHHDKAVHVS